MYHLDEGENVLQCVEPVEPLNAFYSMSPLHYSLFGFNNNNDDDDDASI